MAGELMVVAFRGYTEWMCGIAGFVDQSSRLGDPSGALGAMADRLVHRGPDDGGVWWNGGLRAGLSHRRLSILDVSNAGHQPMLSACGRWAIAFNGEIYGFEALRTELDARRTTPWRGHSDTEVVLECVAQDGFERTVERLSGMFAIAAIDTQDRRLWLASDRAGKKPLYFGWTSGVFAFASEMKALAALGPMPPVDHDAAAMMLRYGYVPAPWSIHRGIRKLPQGSIAELDLRSVVPGTCPRPRAYWSIGELALFPDTVTERGQKHLRELTALLPDARAVLLPCLSRADVSRFAPGDAADRRYGELFRTALAAGVEVLPCRYAFTADAVYWQGLAAVLERQPG
jgi:asparagine synthase (glutamine-hydrolysing)